MRRGVIEQDKSAREDAKAGRESKSRPMSGMAQAGGLEHEQFLLNPTQRDSSSNSNFGIRRGNAAFGLSIWLDWHRLLHA